MQDYFLMNVKIKPNNTISKAQCIEIDKILQYTGGFCLLQNSFTKNEGFTHIISNYSDEMLWSLCGSKDNSYPPYLVTMDWLWESFIMNSKADESKFIPRESDKYEIRRKKINKQGTIFKETVFCFDTSSYTPEDLDYYETLIF